MTPMPNAPNPNGIFGEALARTPAPLPLSTVEEQLAQTRGLNAQVPIQQQQAQELALKNQLTQRTIKNLQIMHDEAPALLQANNGDWSKIRDGLISKGMDADEVEKVVGAHYVTDERMANTSSLIANAKKVNQEILEHNSGIAAKLGTGMLQAVKPDGTLDPVIVQAQLLNAKAQNPDLDIDKYLAMSSKDPRGFMALMEAHRQARPDIATAAEQAQQAHYKTQEAAAAAQKAQFEQQIRQSIAQQLGLPNIPGAPVAAAAKLNTGVAGTRIPFIADAVSREINERTNPEDYQEAYGAEVNQFINSGGDVSKIGSETHKIAERGAAKREALEKLRAENTPGNPIFQGKVALTRAEAIAKNQADLDFLNAQGGMQNLARGIANYEIPLTGGISNRTSPAVRDQLMAEIQRINPDFNAGNFATKQRTENAAITGDIGKQRGSLNTMMGHLDILNQATDALANSDFPALNRIANYLGVQVGSTAKTTYQTIVNRIGPEVTKAYIAGGGTKGERGTNEEDFSPSLAPGQIKANIGVSAQLAGSLIDSLEDRYKGGTFGRGNLKSLVSPEAQAARQRLAGQSPVGGTAPPMPKVLTAADVGKTYTKGGKVLRITRVNPADGTKFLADEVR